MLQRWKRLSAGRTLVSDIVTIANRMPLAPLVREFDLPELDQLRRQLRPRLSWTVLMMKAYALVAAKNPALRQIFVPLPFAHFYEHPENVSMVAITREEHGEPRLYFARFHHPERRSLVELQKCYENFRHAPISEISHFRHQDTFARLPVLLRKPVWFLLTHLWPRKRAHYLGTFGMSLSGFKDTLGTLHLGPSSTTLGYDLFPRKGKCRVTLTFDHRILDGKPAFDVIEALYQTLKNEVTAEVKRMIARQNSVDSESGQSVAPDVRKAG